MNKKLLKYLIIIAAGAAVVLLVCLFMGMFSTTRPYKIYRILCDAFFIAAILLMGGGGIVVINTTGFFDAFGYYRIKMTRFVKNFFTHEAVKYKDFYDFRTARKAQRKFSGWPLVFVGLGFLVVSFVFMFLLESNYYYVK